MHHTSLVILPQDSTQVSSDFGSGFVFLNSVIFSPETNPSANGITAASPLDVKP